MKRNLFFFLIIVTLFSMLLSACAPRASMSAKAKLPVDPGYAEGKQIYFTHTEASNADIAKKMAAGMKSPVLYVPSLASVPEGALSNVYVFTNGVKGTSMSGLQPSVFDNPPETNDYTPLRRLNMVTWKDGSKAHELKSAGEVLGAAKAGDVTIQQPGVVINMPFIVWASGKR